MIRDWQLQRHAFAEKFPGGPNLAEHLFEKYLGDVDKARLEWRSELLEMARTEIPQEHDFLKYGVTQEILLKGMQNQAGRMAEQMKTLANVGLLSRFVGMLTDSRSFLSFPRHEYFRRILCNLLGEWMEEGFIPDDIELVGNLAKRICFGNAKEFLGLGDSS